MQAGLFQAVLPCQGVSLNQFSAILPSFHTMMDDYSHMIAVYIKQNEKKKNMVCLWKQRHMG